MRRPNRSRLLKSVALTTATFIEQLIDGDDSPATGVNRSAPSDARPYKRLRCQEGKNRTMSESRFPHLANWKLVASNPWSRLEAC